MSASGEFQTKVARYLSIDYPELWIDLFYKTLYQDFSGI